MNHAAVTIEELIEMDTEKCLAMSVEELVAYLEPCLEIQKPVYLQDTGGRKGKTAARAVDLQETFNLGDLKSQRKAKKAAGSSLGKTKNKNTAGTNLLKNIKAGGKKKSSALAELIAQNKQLLDEMED